MKKTCSILLLVFIVNTFKVNAQVNKVDSSRINQQTVPDILLKKAKKQKTAAWILVAGGAVVALAGDIIGTEAVERYSADDPFNIFPPGTLAGGAMILGGLGAMVASVPLFIASGRNKKKAHIILKNESQSYLRPFTHKANVFSVGMTVAL